VTFFIPSGLGKVTRCNVTPWKAWSLESRLKDTHERIPCVSFTNLRSGHFVKATAVCYAESEFKKTGSWCSYVGIPQIFNLGILEADYLIISFHFPLSFFLYIYAYIYIYIYIERERERERERVYYIQYIVVYNILQM